MKNKNNIVPITSPYLRRIVRDDLRATDEGYYLIFSIMIETGFPLQNLLDLKVSDLKGKSVLKVPSSKRYGTKRNARISPELKTDLTNYLKGRSSDDFAFISRFTGKQLKVGTFKKALLSVSRYHGIEPAITPMSLFKSYIYDQYLKGNHRGLFSSSHRSYRDLHKYLGLDTPDDNREYLRSGNPKTLFYKEDLLNVIRDRFRETVKTISENTERPDMASEEYIKKVIKFLDQIDSAIGQFNDSL